MTRTCAGDDGCGLSRRHLLSGVGALGVLGAAGLLAGCNGSGAAPSGASASRVPATPQPQPPSPTPAGPPGALVALADVPVAGGVVVAGPVLVVRLAGDTVRAYDAVCPHAGITVGTPDALGRITCPGHGGHFSAADGARLDGPAPRGLTPIAVSIRDGYVVRS